MEKLTAYFSNLKVANETINTLKSLNYTAYLDLKEDELRDKNLRRNIIGTEDAPSLSDLVLKSGGNAEESSKSPLLAADPMVSGMAGFNEIADFDYAVTVEIEAKERKQVIDVVEKAGGTFL